MNPEKTHSNILCKLENMYRTCFFCYSKKKKKGEARATQNILCFQSNNLFRTATGAEELNSCMHEYIL